jgi:repressor LexA
VSFSVYNVQNTIYRKEELKVTSNPESKFFYIAVGNNIKKFRNIRNLSLQGLGERVGLTKKTIQRYENGEIKIDMSRIVDIANAFGIELSQLLEGTEKFLGVSLDDVGGVRLPIVGGISCGNGAIAFEEVEGYEPTPKDWITGGDYFYLRAKGDSMVGARIQDGDMLLIRKQEDVEDGEIAAVLIDDEAVLKRVFKRDGAIILQSENPQFPPMVKTENVKIIGKLKRIIIKT